MKSKSDNPLHHGYLPLSLAIAALVVVPFFLRRKSRVVQRALILGRCSDIFPLLNELRNWPKWMDWTRRSNVAISYEGVPSGVGATQKWSTGRMDGVLRIVQSVPNEQVAYHLDLGYGRQHIDGIMTLEPFGEMTRVTWFCGWDGGSNPYSRYRDLLMKFFINRDFASGLRNLKTLVEESPGLRD